MVNSQIKAIFSTPPIIIVGMHRSGTTLLVQLLEQCGVFMGRSQTKNREARFFQQINKDMLESIGVGWRTLQYLPAPGVLHEKFLWIDKAIRKRLENKFLIEFWPQSRFFHRPKPISHWGWKDPRNCLMLPIWLRLFPQSRIVNIYRDGRDVALSLLQREITREGGTNHNRTLGS